MRKNFFDFLNPFFFIKGFDREPVSPQQETNVVHLLSWVDLLMGDDEIVQLLFTFEFRFFFYLLEIYVAWSIK